LAAASLAVPPFPAASGSVDWVELPRSLAGWEGEDLTIDQAFFGPLFGAQAVYRRYQKPRPGASPQSVEIFVGSEDPENPADRIFSRRAARPGADWSLRERRGAELWALRVRGELAVVSRRSELALVYTWRLRDRGILWHAQRSLLGLDRAPFPRREPRAVVRLATPLARDGPVAIDRAKRTLDRFVADFAAELAAL
jgi:hypothetical protein